MPVFHMRYPGGLAKAVTFSYDDGVEQDKRLIELLDKYGLKATFNINTALFAKETTVYVPGQIHRRMTLEQAKNVYGASGHEISVHTLHHPFLEQLPSNMAVYEIIEDRRRIEENFGVVCRGMAYPYGTTSDSVVECVKNCGMLYARTTVPSNSLDFPSDWLRLRPSCHHLSEQLSSLTEKIVNERCVQAPWLLYIWGHSYEFERDNNWELIETLAEKIAGRPDIWYVSNGEVFEYARAFCELQFSVRGDRVFNPTAYEMFFEDSRSGKIYSVKPGAMSDIKW